MADNSKGLDIRVSITADTASGSRQAASDLDRVTQAAGEAAPATEKLGHAEQEAGEHAEHAHINHRALHMVFRQMGSESIPAVGEAMHALTLGPLGGLIVVGLAVEQIKKHFEELDEQVKKNAESFEGYEEMAAKWREIAQSSAEYQEHLNGIVSNEERIAASLQNQLELRRAIAVEQGKIAAAVDSTADSQIDADVAAGRMTKAQGAANKAAIAAEGKDRASGTGQAESNIQLPEMASELFNAIQRMKEIGPSIKALEDQLNAANHAKNEVAPKLIKDLTERGAELTKQIDDNTERLKIAEQVAFRPNPPQAGIPADLRREEYDRLKNLMDLAMQARSANSDSLAHQQSIRDGTIEGGEQLKDLKSEQQKLQKQIEELPEKIAQAQKLASVSATGGNAVSAAEITKIFNDLLTSLRGASIAPGVTGGFLQDVNAAETAKANGQKLTATQAEVLRQFAAITNAQITQHTELGRFLTAWAKDYNDAKALIIDLRNQLNWRPLRAADQGGH